MAMTTAAVTFTKATRNKLAKTSDGLPAFSIWLDRVVALNHPLLTEAVEGFWCGSEGRATVDMPGSKSSLCVGWYNGRVEWAYIS
jgi:hypothetical protein